MATLVPPHGGVVGAFEGANYEARGSFRPQADCVMFTRDQVPLARTGKPGVVRRMLGAATAVLCALAGAVAITT